VAAVQQAEAAAGAADEKARQATQAHEDALVVAQALEAAANAPGVWHTTSLWLAREEGRQSRGFGIRLV
jgi:hypothetical protein